MVSCLLQYLGLELITSDDLDKSLLLFITHTCTDMGIRIPYDEVARRMGSTFSEGAIIQHISKLRAKMAELNVAPVPPPTKRGAVTTRPSVVYSQRPAQGSSLLLPPPPPQLTPPRTRGKGRKAPAKRTATKIKRSESDIEDDEDEDWKLLSEAELDQTAPAGKRRRTSYKSSGGANLDNSNTSCTETPEARRIRETLNARDEQFQREQRQIEEDLVDQVEGILRQSAEQGTRQHVDTLPCALADEEMYEPVVPHMHALAQFNAAMPTVYQHKEHSIPDVPLSPKSQLVSTPKRMEILS